MGLGSKIIAAVAIGIAIREFFAPFTGHPFDFELWLRLGYYVYHGNDPYTYTYPIPDISMPGSGVMTWLGYPPIWAFFQAGLYSLYVHSGVNDRFFYYFIVKQPMIIADVLCGFVLYKVVPILSGIPKSGSQSLIFWMLCPFIILISAVWGMFDQIILLIVLLSALLVTKTIKSAALVALGFLLKVLPLIYVPLLAFLQETKKRKVAYLVVAGGASFFFTLVPYLFFPKWHLESLIGVGVDVSNKISNSMNYWSIVYVYQQKYSLSQPEIEVLKILAYAWVPAILLATYFCINYVKSVRAQADEIKFRHVLISMLFITLVFMLTKSAVNEQYTIYFLGFGLVDYFALGSRTRRKIFHGIWITALGFAIANNVFLVRFLEPLSTLYVYEEYVMTQGLIGNVRFGLLATFGICFSILSFLYLRSLYHDMRSAILKERGEVKGKLVGANVG